MTFGTGKYKQKGYQSWCQRCPKCWANGITGFSQWTELETTSAGIIETCNECNIVILKDRINKKFMKSKWKILEDPVRIRVFGIIDNSEKHPHVHMVKEIKT